MRKYFILLMLISLSDISGQQIWNLESCINYALQHKTEILQQEETSKLSQKQLQFSKLKLLPSLEFDATQTYESYNEFDQNSNKWKRTEPNVTETGIYTKLGVFSSLYNYNNIQMYKYLNLKSKNKLDQVKNEIKLAVLAAYTNCLYYKESYEISLKQRDLLEAEKKNCEILLTKGNKSELDLLEINARILNENVNLADASKKLNESFINLKKSIELPDSGNLNINQILLPTEINYSIPSTDSIYSCAVLQLPDFQQFDNQIEASNYLIKSIKSQYYPHIDLTGSLSSSMNSSDKNPLEPLSYYSYNSQFKNNFLTNIGIQLTIPIYSRHEIRQRVVEEQSNQEDILLQKQKALNDIYFEIETITNNVRTYSKNFEALKQTVKSYSEIFDLKEKQYERGVITFLEYVTAKNNFEKSEIELTNNKYNLLYYLKLVDFYLGKPLSI